MIKKILKDFPEVIDQPDWWVDNWENINFEKQLKFMEIIGKYEGQSKKIDNLIYKIKTKLGK